MMEFSRRRASARQSSLPMLLPPPVTSVAVRVMLRASSAKSRANQSTWNAPHRGEIVEREAGRLGENGSVVPGRGVHESSSAGEVHGSSTSVSEVIP